MKINNLFYSTLILSLLLIGCNNNNPFKNNKNVSQATDGIIQRTEDLNKNFTLKQVLDLFLLKEVLILKEMSDNIMHDWNNTPTQQYVRSFFIDETEVTNLMYVEYLHWMNKVFAEDFPEI